ncbi:putative leucine-rich repeat-containing protein DDB_G0290503 isoform X2 [Onthophagus taurus]|uniref:putative leucine-rich repeat-containing protein DDB_G0290503 isoform X2 n=1 Tax=Onthophagus taurus TaxID=166361 RepID=UPI0039BE4F24
MEEIETLQSPSDVSLELVPCAICSRTFLPASLLKHSKVCEKNARKKRKIFDSLKQRIEGTDLAEFHQKSYLKSKQHEEPEPKLIKNNWKQKHMQLVEAIRAAKGTNNEQTENNEMKYQKRKSANIGTPTNTRCPSCDRNFGPKAYDRHVEWCKEKRTSEIHKSPASMLAKERLEARIKYKVPPLCKAKKITVKEKYSPTQNSPRNMKSASACTLDRSPSVRKSKNSIQRGGDSSQDEYLEKKVGDIGVKQVVSERILKDEVKNQNSNNKSTKLNNLDVNTLQGLTVNSIIKSSPNINKKIGNEKKLEGINLRESTSLNLKNEKGKLLVKESCSDTIRGLNRFNSKLPILKKSYSGPYLTKSPRRSPLNLSPKKNLKSPTIIEVKPKPSEELEIKINKEERYDSDYYDNKISSLQETLNDIQMINLEVSPREEILFSDDEVLNKNSSDSVTSSDLINFDESCEKFLEKNRLLSANLKIDPLLDQFPSEEDNKIESDYNVKLEININLDKNEENENKITFKDVECQDFDEEKIVLSENLIDIDNDLIDFNKKIDLKLLNCEKVDKGTQSDYQKNDFGCQCDFRTTKKIKSGNKIKQNKIDLNLKQPIKTRNKEKKVKRIEKISSGSSRKLNKSDRRRIKRPKSNVEYKTQTEIDKEINYYSDFELNLNNKFQARRKNMMGGDQIEMVFVEKFNDKKKENLYEEAYIKPGEPKTLMSEYKKINYLDDSNTDLFKNQVITNNNNKIIEQYPLLSEIFYDEKYKNNSKGDYHQQILTTETVHVFETGKSAFKEPKNIEYIKNLESIKENIKIIQENIKEESLKRNNLIEKSSDLEITNSPSSNFIYWRKPNRSGFSESDSVVDGCENHHSQALSCARIERQIRNCCSDLCLTKTSETSFKLNSEIDLRNYSSYQNIQHEDYFVTPKLSNHEDNLKKKILETENLLNDTSQCESMDLKQVLSTIQESNSSSKNEIQTSICDSCSIVTPRFLEILKTVIEPDRNGIENDEMIVSRKHCRKMLLIDKKGLANVKTKLFFPELPKKEKKVTRCSPKRIVLPQIITTRNSSSKHDHYYRKEGTKSAGCSAKKKNLSSLKRSISLLDQKPKPLKNKQDVQNYFNEQEKNSAKVIIHSIEAQKPPPLIMNDELFSVDDDMYEEYKKYEELYLKEREEELRKEEIDEEDNRNSKISADSAYGSLTRKSTPKTRARSTKLAPLDKHKMLPDSPSSSSSESSPIPSNVPLKMSKFCHECGSKYPLAAAKFCVECGIKRLVL